MSHINVLIGV